MTDDLPRVIAALDSISAHGGTSLYNALYVMLRDFQKAASDRSTVRRRAIVVLSDGADTGSLISFDDVLDLARRAGVTVYTVAMQSRVAPPGGLLPRRFLSQADYAMRALAEETGARAFFPTTGLEVRDVYDTIASELASQYAIGYTSRNAQQNGAWRHVLVRIASRPGMRSRTRTGTSRQAFECCRPRCANDPGWAARQDKVSSPMNAGRRAATVLLLLTLIGGATLPWVACARGSSIRTISGAALAVYAAGHLVCHQRTERSFASCGYQWPVCGRCAGLYMGAAAGVLMFALWRPDRVARAD